MNHSKRKILGIALSFTLLFPTLAHAAEDKPSFSDVAGTFWARDAIDSMVQLGVLKGFEDRSFKPQSPVTREQFAQILTLSFYLDLPSDKLQAFQDVSSSRWSYSAIQASKDFLTGYYPPSGKAFFDPTGKASREDVAVALVKTLGYQPDDLVDKNILNRFGDEDEISPGLRNYVALAVEKKLLTGYNNWTLKPADGVTRAEAASLVYRVIKGASGDSQASLALNVAAPEKTSSPTFYITGDVTKGASVFINNTEAEVSQGQFRVAIQLQEEGTYTYTVTARLPGGKTQTATKTVVFEKGAPVLEVNGVPETTNKQSVTVSWKVKDDNDYAPEVYVNDVKQSYGNSLEVKLTEGVNIIKVRATNRSGRSTEVIKQVSFLAGGPALTVADLPASTNKEIVTVTWTVKDGNDYSPKVYLNDRIQSYGNSAEVTLKPGVNTIVVRAVNSLGKESVVTKSISFAAEGPVLKVENVPESTSKGSLRLTWTVMDTNDYNPKVYVNDEQNPYGSTTVALKPGVNTYRIKAVNKLGQSTEIIRTITFTPAAPVLALGYAPEKTSSARVTLTWTVSDENDRSPAIFLNDQLLYSGGSVSLDLKPGLNTFKLAATNSYGKTTEILYTVTLEEAAPASG